MGNFHDGQHGIYARGSSSDNETFEINYHLRSGFYSLKDGARKVQKCMEGRYGRQEDKLWREEDLSTTPWRKDASIPPPPYGAVDRAAYSTGYQHR